MMRISSCGFPVPYKPLRGNVSTIVVLVAVKNSLVDETVDNVPVVEIYAWLSVPEVEFQLNPVAPTTPGTANELVVGTVHENIVFMLYTTPTVAFVMVIIVGVRVKDRDPALKSVAVPTGVVGVTFDLTTWAAIAPVVPFAKSIVGL